MDIGENMQLYNGDCLEILKDIPDKSIDLILTDPPYGTTQCKWDSIIPFEKMWPELERIIKDNGAILLFGSEPFSSALRMSNLKMYKYDLYWKKEKPTNFLQLKKRFGKVTENICVFYKKQCTYNPQMTEGEPYNKGCAVRDTLAYGKQEKAVLVKNDTGLRYPRSVQYFVTAEREGKLHPTQKPLALMEWLIKTYTNEGDTVLDPCMGSGTTAIACINTGRKFIGFEKDTEYYNKALERINNHLNKCGKSILI